MWSETYMNTKKRTVSDPLSSAWRAISSHLTLVAILSGVSNILMLTPTILMLTIYQRVIPSQSVETLVIITAVSLVLIGVAAACDGIRTKVIIQANSRMNRIASPSIIRSALHYQIPQNSRGQFLKELDQIRATIAGPLIAGVMDLPWVPVFLVAAYLLHHYIFLFIVVFLTLLIATTLLSQRASRRLEVKYAQGNALTEQTLSAAIAKSDVVEGLGMAGVLTRKYYAARMEVEADYRKAAFMNADFGAVSRFLRLCAQIGILSVTALLVLKGQASAAVIFAASLLQARALAPFENLMAGGQQVGAVRRAIASLRERAFPATLRRPSMRLQPPSGSITFESVVLPAAHSSNRVLMKIENFSIRPGQCIQLHGASGAGKTTLLYALLGVYPILKGAIRFDETDVREWNSEQLAGAIGYVPADAALFAGTIKENISRFATAAGPDEKIIAAAKASNTHSLIQSLPMGYNTPIGINGRGLSSGQSQQIALARALYGDPNIVILDEPDSHLDEAGIAALTATIDGLRKRGATVLICSHRAMPTLKPDAHVHISRGVARLDILNSDEADDG